MISYAALMVQFEINIFMSIAVLQGNVSVCLAGMVSFVAADAPLVPGGRHVTKHVTAVSMGRVIRKMANANVLVDGLESTVIRLVQTVFMEVTVNIGKKFIFD